MVLHARRKGGHHHDVEYAEATEIGYYPQSINSRTSKRSSSGAPEIRYALLAVVSFLFMGVVLGYFLLHHQHRKVILHIMTNPWAHAGAALSGRAGFRHHFYSGNPRSVTVVVPSVVNPAKRTRRLKSILETWGPSARAVYVVHNVSEFPEAAHAVISDTSAPSDPYSYPQLLLVPESIGVDDGLPRLNHVIRTIHEKIDPDFAFFVNDHTYVIPEHLCYFLEDEDPAQDMYAGHALKNNVDAFNSGAAGYALSRETMKRLVDTWDAEDPTCLLKDETSSWLQGNPGLVTTRCLREVLHVVATDTRQENKWHRFHAFPLTRLVSGKVDKWYLNKHEGMEAMIDTDPSYSTLLSGVDCCAQDTVSFHYVEYLESKALFATREALLENPYMKDHELKGIMLKEWPRSQADLGGYSRGLPRESDEGGWKPLLQVMRKISSRHTQRDC